MWWSHISSIRACYLCCFWNSSGSVSSILSLEMLKFVYDFYLVYILILSFYITIIWFNTQSCTRTLKHFRQIYVSLRFYWTINIHAIYRKYRVVLHTMFIRCIHIWCCSTCHHAALRFGHTHTHSSQKQTAYTLISSSVEQKSTSSTFE